MRPSLRLAATASATACLAGCAPALDWRDVRPAGTALQMQFPCKPVEQQRQVALAGAPVRLALLACSADGQTWGLAHADVTDPARVTPALLQLRASAAANVAVALDVAAASAPALQVPGSTPNTAGAQARMAGSLPDGTPVQMQLVVFAHGTRVFQATVLGQQLPQAAVETYFAAMVIRP